MKSTKYSVGRICPIRPWWRLSACGHYFNEKLKSVGRVMRLTHTMVLSHYDCIITYYYLFYVIFNIHREMWLRIMINEYDKVSLVQSLWATVIVRACIYVCLRLNHNYYYNNKHICIQFYHYIYVYLHIKFVFICFYSKDKTCCLR